MRIEEGVKLNTALSRPGSGPGKSQQQNLDLTNLKYISITTSSVQAALLAFPSLLALILWIMTSVDRMRIPFSPCAE